VAGQPYTGRLAFDPDTCFHVDPDGEPVVTDDGGQTWRYATDEDTSHNDRYEERVVAIDSTANKLEELAYEHGIEKATELLEEQEPHHFEVQPDDDHFLRVKQEQDPVAESVTSHTDAWKDS
jgi:hypothetical protein